MLVRSLHTSDFRNLHEVAYKPHPRVNVIFGDNGQGKTNLLEAAYLLATLRSFRTSYLEELLRLDAAGAATLALAPMPLLWQNRAAFHSLVAKLR